MQRRRERTEIVSMAARGRDQGAYSFRRLGLDECQGTLLYIFLTCMTKLCVSRLIAQSALLIAEGEWIYESLARFNTIHQIGILLFYHWSTFNTQNILLVFLVCVCWSQYPEHSKQDENFLMQWTRCLMLLTQEESQETQAVVFFGQYLSLQNKIVCLFNH